MLLIITIALALRLLEYFYLTKDLASMVAEYSRSLYLDDSDDYDLVVDMVTLPFNGFISFLGLTMIHIISAFVLVGSVGMFVAGLGMFILYRPHRNGYAFGVVILGGMWRIHNSIYNWTKRFTSKWMESFEMIVLQVGESVLEENVEEEEEVAPVTNLETTTGIVSNAR